jgi:hypothetical protein
MFSFSKSSPSLSPKRYDDPSLKLLVSLFDLLIDEIIDPDLLEILEELLLFCLLFLIYFPIPEYS